MHAIITITMQQNADLTIAEVTEAMVKQLKKYGAKAIEDGKISVESKVTKRACSTFISNWGIGAAYTVIK